MAAIVYTDIGRDGMLSGLNLEQTVALAARSTTPVIASGGVGGPQDLIDLRRAAAGTRIEGVIVGRALYDGRVDPAEALALAVAIALTTDPHKLRGSSAFGWQRGSDPVHKHLPCPRRAILRSASMLKLRVIPCLDVKDGRVVKGVNFVSLARRRRSGRAGRAVRRGRRRRAVLPRHHRQPREPRHDPGRGVAHRGAGVPAADGRRRHPLHRGHAPPAAGRHRQVQHQLGGGGAAGAGARGGDRNSAASASWWRWTRSSPGRGGGRCSPMAAAAAPASMPWHGAARWLRLARARSC